MAIFPEMAQVIGTCKSVEQFSPIGDFILIEPLPRTTTRGGLAIPDGADPEPPRGRVVKVGPGRITEFGSLIPMPVVEGEQVYLTFAYQQPLAITLGDKQYILTRSRDLVGKVQAA